MKIYVVTKGGYSEYHIVTATTDREKAEKLAKKFSDDCEDAEVEEYEDSDVYLRKLWYVRFNENGEVEKIKLESDAFYYTSDKVNCVCYNTCGCYGIIYETWVYVFADTEEEAIKIASEKRAEFLAKMNGLV